MMQAENSENDPDGPGLSDLPPLPPPALEPLLSSDSLHRLDDLDVKQDKQAGPACSARR